MKIQYQIILLLIAFSLAFLIGYLPEHFKAKSLESIIQKNEETFDQQIKVHQEEKTILENQIKLAKIKNALVITILETDKKNYGIALDNFKNFIEQWEKFKNNSLLKGKITDDDIKRDEIVSDLSKGNAAAKDKLIILYEKMASLN